MVRKELSQNIFSKFRLKTKKVLVKKGLSAGVVKLTSKDGSPNWVNEYKTIDNRFYEVKSTKQGIGRAEHDIYAYRLRYLASFGIYELPNSKLCDLTGA